MSPVITPCNVQLPHVSHVPTVSNVGESLFTEGALVYIGPAPFVLQKCEIELDHGLHLIQNYIEEMR